MDIRQLSYFVRVAELGSFSRASTFLRVAQPALSRQIHNLEVELKERLLIRNGRGVEPTEAGERLLSNARGILRLIERTYEDIENARNRQVRQGSDRPAGDDLGRDRNRSHSPFAGRTVGMPRSHWSMDVPASCRSGCCRGVSTW